MRSWPSCKGLGGVSVPSLAVLGSFQDVLGRFRGVLCRLGRLVLPWVCLRAFLGTPWGYPEPSWKLLGGVLDRLGGVLGRFCFFRR